MTHELRWNPVLKEWVIVGSNRRNRPLHLSGANPQNCPFCPESSEMGGREEVVSLPNKFPCLFPDPPISTITKADDFYKVRQATGFCEIVVETPKHKGDLSDLSVERLYEILRLFAKRYKDLGSDKRVKYVFIFRNKGKEIGATIHHPHSQIYGLPFVPPLIEKELISSREFMKRYNECLFCNIIKKEIEDGRRVIYKDDLSICFLPFFARWTYETHLYPMRHVQSLSELEHEEIESLACVLKIITTVYNNLFGFSMPYVMAVHQKPTDGKSYQYYHFHIEFYPVHQSRERVKYTAGIERVGTFEYGSGSPEEKAEELKQVYRNVAGKIM